jgi:hypothetical protein
MPLPEHLWLEVEWLFLDDRLSVASAMFALRSSYGYLKVTQDESNGIHGHRFSS